MKTISFIISCLVLTASVKAQSDSWKIYHNKKLLLSSSEENESKNVVHIKISSLKKNGQLSIVYREAVPNKDWKRTFALFDEKDSSLFEKNAVSIIRISNASLKKIIARNKKIRIYTWSMPQNPAIAAAIRIRRVHLCTLELE